MKYLAFVLHIGIITINSILARKRVDDVLADERCIVRKQQAASLRWLENLGNSIIMNRVYDNPKNSPANVKISTFLRTLNAGVGLLDFGC